MAKGLLEVLQEEAVHLIGQLALSVREAGPLHEPVETARHVRAPIRQAESRAESGGCAD